MTTTFTGTQRLITAHSHSHTTLTQVHFLRYLGLLGFFSLRIVMPAGSLKDLSRDRFALYDTLGFVRTFRVQVIYVISTCRLIRTCFQTRRIPYTATRVTRSVLMSYDISLDTPARDRDLSLSIEPLDSLTLLSFQIASLAKPTSDQSAHCRLRVPFQSLLPA